MEDDYLNLAQVPARVDSINIHGLGRTKDDFVKWHINDLFNAQNFNDVIFKATEVQQKLLSIGCFRSVSIVIDTSKEVPTSIYDGYDVTFNVKENGRFVGGVNTMIGSNEGSIVLGCRMPNTFGRGEKISIEKSFGTSRDRSNLISINKPLNLGKILSKAETTASLFQRTVPNPFSGFNLYTSGGLLDFSFESAQKIKHSMQWECAWREIEANSRSTSFAVREQSGHSIKSSLRHIVAIDHRDHPIFPNRGTLLKLSQEYAGLGGDTAFIKHDSELQLNFPIPVIDYVIQFGLRVGFLKPIESKNSNHNISDLFFLGGPQTLRGFEMKSVGKRAGNDMLGGQAYWASGLHLYAPLPVGKKTFQDVVRGHLFCNFGGIATHDLTSHYGIVENVKLLLQDFRFSYGLGLAFRLGNMAKLELNYCIPVRYTKGDRPLEGLQFGVGVEFI